MQEIIVQGVEKQSKIVIGESIESYKKYLPENKVIILSDENLMKYYGEYFKGFDIITLSTGEEIKTLQTVFDVYAKLLDLNIDRTSFLLAVGGGIVCDIAGFIASTYMRGMSFGFISTSLLSQVDASVGGKNGVNFKGFKNIIGVFNQPDFVLCIPQMLETLPQREIANGFAEVIKYACIADEKLFEYLESNIEKAKSLDKDTIEFIVVRSIKIKADIVSEDEKEHGIRRILNFGHTLGHAIEKEKLGYMHGEAVGLGMLVAVKLSEKIFNLSGIYDRLEKLLTSYDLPTTLPENVEKIIKHVKKDKKKEDDFLYFILLEQIGKAKIHKFAINELEEHII